MTILERERATYEDMLAMPIYHTHSPGVEWLDVFAERAHPPVTVLDAGSGTGQALRALLERGYRAVGCDLVVAADLPIAPACLWHDLRPFGRFDYVYCCDVLEHIPTPFTMLVVRNLLAIVDQAAFFSISLIPDLCGAWVGTELHHSVQSFSDWRDQLRELGLVVDARDLGTVGLYWVEPR